MVAISSDSQHSFIFKACLNILPLYIISTKHISSLAIGKEVTNMHRMAAYIFQSAFIVLCFFKTLSTSLRIW